MNAFFKYTLTALSFLILELSFPVAAQSVHLPINRQCNVIYDNDDHRDTYTDELLLSLNDTKRLKVIAFITSYSGDATEYKLFIKGRRDIIEKAERSGFRHLPKAVDGPNRPLTRPLTNRIRDTKPLNSEAGLTIVAAARKAIGSRPLIIITGGQLTAIADAYLIDSSIVDKVFVIPWAWAIVVAKFKCLSISDSENTYNDVFKNGVALTGKDRFAAALKDQQLPQTEFTDWLLAKRHPVHPLSYMDRDGDSPSCIPLLRPDYLTKVSRWSCSGINAAGLPILKSDEAGQIYVALSANQQIATSEFWRAILREK
jgi:hypothetical protein